MGKTIEFIIQNGRALRRTTFETELNFDDDLQRKLSANAVLKIPWVETFDAKGCSGVGVAQSAGFNYWTVRLQSLQLRCPWHPIKAAEKQILVPNFVRTSQDPVLSMEWIPPAGMTLLVVLTTQMNGVKSIMFKVHLLARNKVWKYYRLPLANLHPDAMVCTGSQNAWKETAQLDLVRQEIDKLRNSQFNSDLWSTVEQTQKMFQFEPTPDGAGYKQMAPPEEWWDLCRETSIPFIQMITL